MKYIRFIVLKILLISMLMLVSHDFIVNQDECLHAPLVVNPLHVNQDTTLHSIEHSFFHFPFLFTSSIVNINLNKLQKKLNFYKTLVLKEIYISFFIPPKY